MLCTAENLEGLAIREINSGLSNIVLSGVPRRGLNASYEDLATYQKMIVAVNGTIRIMHEIDEIVLGWPLP
jgi:hypothetical protein